MNAILTQGLFAIFLFFNIFKGYSQKPISDIKYKEDQIYVSGTFHLISKLPSQIRQNRFSGGIHFGLIKDIPVNTSRNFALGVGLGYSINNYNTNLRISSNNSEFGAVYTRIDIADYTNTFSTQIIEFPFEFRWRTSTSQSYKFWRFYTGIKIGYLHAFKSIYEDATTYDVIKSPVGLQRWRVGATLSAGWNTFNIYAYYGLNPFFDTNLSEGSIFIPIKIGIMFYIL